MSAFLQSTARSSKSLETLRNGNAFGLEECRADTRQRRFAGPVLLTQFGSQPILVWLGEEVCTHNKNSKENKGMKKEHILHCVKCYECALRWLTDVDIQRLPQSRRQTSLSSTDGGRDDCVLLLEKWALVGPTKAYGTMNWREFRCGCEE